MRADARAGDWSREVLADSALFGGLDPEALDAVVAGVERATLQGGEVLFRQGEAGDALYVVLGGRLRVELERGDEPEVIREVGRGETVGELALITGHPRSASVRAIRDTELVRLSVERFRALLEEHPRTAVRLTRVLADWVTSANVGTSGEPGVSTVAVVGGTPGAPAAATARALAGVLAAAGTTLHVDAARVDAALGEGTARTADGTERAEALLRWLDEQERRTTYVLYEADAELTPWTRRCLRHADRILQVVRPDERPADDPEATMSGRWAVEELVLAHRPGTRTPQDTGKWLVGRGRARHHHIREGMPEDIARLGRRLTGAGIGLVLSGGGARGFAHLGVLRALEEAGVPVDRIGGTSMGAVIAAQYAAGYSVEEMLDLNRRGWQRFRPHRDYTLPYVSLVTERAAERMLRMMFGDTRIEDFWLDCFAVSTNLTRAELQVHRRGPAVDALLASIAIPGVAPPIVGREGDLFVDGGVLDNLPLAELQRGAQGLAIAVNASPTVDMEIDRAYGQTPSGWRVLANRLRPWGVRRFFPNIFEILARTAIVASAREARRAAEAADLYLRPPTDRWKLFDMDRLDEIAEAGYRYAAPVVADWWAGQSAGRPVQRSTRVLV